MNILDENVIEDQRELLRRWRIPTRQIGQDIGFTGMKDNDHIIPLLHQLSRPTLFTRDRGFYLPRHCHSRYCVACLHVSQYEVARFIRRFLRHPECMTWSQRRGTVVQIGHDRLRRWRLHRDQEELVAWSR